MASHGSSPFPQDYKTRFEGSAMMHEELLSRFTVRLMLDGVSVGRRVLIDTESIMKAICLDSNVA